MPLLHPSATVPFPKPADTALAERGLERWLEHAASHPDPEVKAFVEALADDPQGRAILDGVCGNSPYLALSLGREPAFVRRFLTEGFDQPFADLLSTLEAEYAGETDGNRLMAALRVAKRRAALLIAVADIAGVWPLERVTAALSDTAETTLRLACRHLLRKAATDGMLDLPHPEDPAKGSGLIVLGMGKLGARELNYSSDIDLIVLYDDAVVRSSKPEHLSRTFIRLARDLVRIMDERTQDGYVFRTDLRLRPDPGSTPLAVSVSAAEIYYGSVGQNWERAAMIKARPVAGDLEAGAGFMKFLKPFVWRRHLDFAAIQDIHSIKRQINAHKGHREVTINGHDIKLGRGGIREIEFFAQTQQLIFGGRDDSLRTPATCMALKSLVASERVTAPVAEQMAQAYRFLRRVEHRVQMIEDQQTHKLPTADEDVAKLAVFLGYDDAAAFRSDMLETMGVVEDNYAELFEEAPPLAGPGNLVFTGTEDDPETVETLKKLGYANPSGVGATVRGWHHGRYRATRSTRSRELLTELVPAILEALGRQPLPDTALINFDQFLGRLPAGVQLFSLFYANPKLLDLVAEIMGTAPLLAEQLARNPALLDNVLTPGFLETLPTPEQSAADFARVMSHAQNFEDNLLIARRWANDQKFRAGVHILRHVNDGDRCGQFLSDVAGIVLAGLEQAVRDEFAKRHGHFPGAALAILGMGKLGERQMSLGSDLDLILVYRVPPGLVMSDGPKPLSPNEYYTKLTQRLISAITSQTSEGRLYEVDMRLRPSGNAGPLAVSLESFVKYQDEGAWTWEHMALTRARVVVGPEELRRDIEAAIRRVLTKPRDADRLLWDVADMRRRIDQEFGTPNPWAVKYARGGLIDIEFIAQYLLLRHAHDHPDILTYDMAAALANLAAVALLDGAMALELVVTLRLWRRVQAYLRLTTEGKFNPEEAPLPLKQALVSVCFPNLPAPVDFPEADSKIRDAAQRASQHFRTLVAEPAKAVPPPAQKE